MQNKYVHFWLMSCLVVSCSFLKNDPKMGTDAEAKQQKAPAPKVSSIESKQIASEAQSNFVAEITFARGKSSLPVVAEKDIKRILDQALKKGDVGEVKVITWADEEYPSKKKKVLKDASLKLVKDRNDNLERYIQKLDEKIEVSKISMAERPDLMENILSNEDVRLKKSLEEYGIPTSTSRNKSDRKASKSIVIFILDQTTP